jgi:hypothetical protein
LACTVGSAFLGVDLIFHGYANILLYNALLTDGVKPSAKCSPRIRGGRAASLKLVGLEVNGLAFR